MYLHKKYEMGKNPKQSCKIQTLVQLITEKSNDIFASNHQLVFCITKNIQLVISLDNVLKNMSRFFWKNLASTHISWRKVNKTRFYPL